MIWLALLLLIAAVLISFVKIPTNNLTNTSRGKNALVTLTAGLALVLIILSSLTTISSGAVGVQVLFGKVDTDGYLSEGLHLKNPFSLVHEMSVRTQTYTM